MFSFENKILSCGNPDTKLLPLAMYVSYPSLTKSLPTPIYLFPPLLKSFAPQVKSFPPQVKSFPPLADS